MTFSGKDFYFFPEIHRITTREQDVKRLINLIPFFIQVCLSIVLLDAPGDPLVATV